MVGNAPAARFRLSSVKKWKKHQIVPDTIYQYQVV